MAKVDFRDFEGFVEKFKPKLTTDDCYTPPIVYDAVLYWVKSEYGISENTKIVRPFFPGGDYEKHRYPDGCIVVDNPPFSILSKIISFYIANKIKFFLFAPTLTLFSSSSSCCAIPVGTTVTYENGAKVNTSFVTNMETGTRVRTAPSLYKAVEKADKENTKEDKKELPKYIYPDEIITAAMVYRWSKYGVDFRLPVSECARIGTLDAQRKFGKSIFGNGYILSERMAAERAAAERAAAERAAAERAAAERAAAERAAAERAAATVWALSEEEREIVRSLTDGTYYDKTQLSLFGEVV